MIIDIMFEGMKKRSLTLNCFLGGFWDFTADLSSKDTAYTQEALPLHTGHHILQRSSWPAAFPPPIAH